jgi:hypothetical protein
VGLLGRNETLCGSAGNGELRGTAQFDPTDALVQVGPVLGDAVALKLSSARSNHNAATAKTPNSISRVRRLASPANNT